MLLFLTKWGTMYIWLELIEIIMSILYEEFYDEGWCCYGESDFFFVPDNSRFVHDDSRFAHDDSRLQVVRGKQNRGGG